MKFFQSVKKELKHIRQVMRERAFVGKKLEQDIVTQFHKLYYHADSVGKGYKDTYFMGVPIRKCPMDTWVYQEILFELKPDVIVECGTSHGGSALYLASLCELMKHGRVVTIDIVDLPRPQHPRISYLLGSSVDSGIVTKVRAQIKTGERVMVILDSDHSRDHVYKEMIAYAPMVTTGQYMIVEDTNVNGHPVYPEHGPGPMEALDAFLPDHPEFRIDRDREKFYLTFNPRGYLKRN